MYSQETRNKTSFQVMSYWNYSPLPFTTWLRLLSSGWVVLCHLGFCFTVMQSPAPISTPCMVPCSYLLHNMKTVVCVATHTQHYRAQNHVLCLSCRLCATSAPRTLCRCLNLGSRVQSGSAPLATLHTLTGCFIPKLLQLNDAHDQRTQYHSRLTGNFNTVKYQSGQSHSCVHLSISSIHFHHHSF